MKESRCLSPALYLHKHLHISLERRLGATDRHALSEGDMPRYFFHVQDDGGTFLDEEGPEFPDLKAVRREAMKACGDLLREVADTVRDDEPF
jgi:hypothetical protein